MKFKKTLLAVGTAATIAAPVAAVVACSSTEQADKDGGIWTQYGREHDLLLSLGIAPQYHVRADLGSTKDIQNEGYLNPYTNDSLTKIGNSKGDKEYFMMKSLGLHLSVDTIDPSLTLKDKTRQFFPESSDNFGEGTIAKTDIQGLSTNAAASSGNPDAWDLSKPGQDLVLNWPGEETKLAAKIDGIIGGTDGTYAKRAAVINQQWSTRQAKLVADANKLTDEKTILVVRGDDDATKGWSGIIPKSHLSEMYGLKHLSFASPTSYDKIEYGIGANRAYLIKGKTSNTNKTELLNAFAKTADYVVYLETPKAHLTDDQKSKIQLELKGMLKDGQDSKVLMQTYDGWYMPFRGAAIGANVVMDNLETEFLGGSIDNTWKDTYKATNLKNIYLPNVK